MFRVLMPSQRIFRLIAVAVAFLSATLANAQSLRETTDWLRDFVQVEGTVRNKDWHDTYHVTANGCEITIFHDTEDLSCTRPENKCGPGFVSTHHFKQVFNLKDMDLARISVEDVSFFGAHAVNLNTVNERPLVSHFIDVGSGRGVIWSKESADSEYQAYVVLRRRDAADRIAKAFRHAAEVCGAKASPF
jgi:hypothetical protein